MTKKEFRKKIRKMFRKENLYKIVIFVIGLALVSTSVLPYIL
ncbi:MAG: hypothetical protein KatS3mg101_0399 [Patescibacteria group bacterium]|nr:MAG: hypothetical protein KatS3mg101_0399 [Patescibacteria group bacterium]